ncbi:BMP family lipoprotein, partial [Streptomyces sp. NPDC005122]
MSRRTRFSQAAVAVSVIALAAVGCGKSSTESSGGGSDKSSSGYSGKGIGLAYDIGGKGDQSFNDAAFAGFQKAETEFKIGGRDIEPQDGESDADKVQRLEQLAKSGYNPVIGVGFVYAPAIKEVAAKYPKITFGIIDDEQDKAANIADLVFHEEQSSYLAGVAAAKATKKNHIGFIGGVDIPLIHKFEAGFDQGAKSVNPKIKIESQYLTQTPQEGGFASPDK